MAGSRLFPVGALTIAISALVGGVMGRNVAASEDRLSEDERTFTAALTVIETRYVDKVESDRLVYGAISGMLQTLDPHSNFMDPRQYAQLRERQEGRYYGLGITISAVDGDITVVSLFEGSPAYKQGIRRGDVIAKVGDESAKGWTTEDAVQRLRGKKGTTVDVYLKRPGIEGLFKVTVERDEITIPTIPAEFMLDAQTGYVRLQDFAENTDRDLVRA
jgi:carboxyl-terminal processing protease